MKRRPIKQGFVSADRAAPKFSRRVGDFEADEAVAFDGSLYRIGIQSVRSMISERALPPCVSGSLQ